MNRLAGLVLVVCGVVLALGSPQPALGHATLRSSDPAANSFLQRPPAQLTLTFSEPIESKSSTIVVLDALGRQLKADLATVSGVNMSLALPTLPPGIYNVVWTNVSRIDGHPIRGSFPFTVLNPDGSVPDQANAFSGVQSSGDPVPLADGVAVRALSLLGLAMVVAGAVITLLWREAGAGLRRSLTMCVYAGAVVLLAATLLNLVTIRDAYSGQGLADLVLETPAGGYWLTRIGLVLLIGVVATFSSDAPRRAAGALLACVTVYLWAFTATSHAAASVGSSWAKGVDVAHGVAALTWIGAVVGVALAARIAPRDANWGALMPRFGILASTMVFVLLATGFLGALVQLDKVSRLWETRYGVILLVKLGLMVPLLGVAGYNAKWGKARLVAAFPGAQRRFLYFATAEVGLGLAVFLAAAMLTQATASKLVQDAPESKPFAQEATFDDLQISLSIDPNRTGLNTYRVEVKDSAGTPIEVQRVRLTFRYQEDATIGASSLTLARSGEVYLGQGPFMTLEGRWRVETEVRRADSPDVVGFFDVRPAGLPVIAEASTGAWANPAPGVSWNEFGGFIFLLGGLGFALARTPLRRFGREAGWAANGMTMAGFAFGVLLLFGVHAHEPEEGLPANPIYPDSNSISQGRTLFQQNCAECHGRNGVPPQGLNLNPYPLDLTVHVPQHPDGQLFQFINNGLPGTAMRAWGRGEGALSEEQIWHLVNFMRTLSPVDR